MLIDTTHRTDLPEIMDDFSMDGEELKTALDKIARINQLLGGNRLTLDGIKDLLPEYDPETEITIIDLGCGNGDMLRMTADYAEKNNFKFRLIGVDANQNTVNYAKELSINYPNIKYICTDIFGAKVDEMTYDIALFTLTLHHFTNSQINDLLRKFHHNAKIGIVINDLHRSSIAYRLFQGLCFILRMNSMSKNDGLVSILRGFKKSELVALSKKLNYKNYKIQWKWAFRYQWIISKI